MIFRKHSRTVLATMALIAVFPVLGCGQRSALIPKQDATQVLAQLDAIQQLMDSGQCEGLAQAITNAQSTVSAFPESVDAELVARIQQGLSNLTTQAPRDCKEGIKTTTTDTTTTATTTTSTTDTSTTPTETSTTPPPTTTTTPPPEPTPTPTTPTPTPTTPEPPGTGGAGTGGGSGGTGGISPDGE
jgi:hypothetical protein